MWEMVRNWLPPVAAVIIACMGGYTDITSQKIPNEITLHAMSTGLLINLLLGGLGGVASWAGGLLLGFAFFPLYLVGALKAGDVKLYMAIGAVGGWHFGLYVMVLSVLFGGVTAFLLMLVRKDGRRALRSLWNYLANMVLTRTFSMYQPQEKSAYFSYGCCISAGAVAALIWMIIQKM